MTKDELIEFNQEQIRSIDAYFLELIKHRPICNIADRTELAFLVSHKLALSCLLVSECKHNFKPNGYGYGFRNFKCADCGKTKTERTDCPD